MKKIKLLNQFPMSDWEQMDQFIATTHGSDHILRHRPIFEWFFLRDENKEFANMLVAYEDDKLISLLGYLPTKFQWDGQVVNGVWTAFWMTLEGHRFGIGVLLMRKLTELFPIIATQGASMMNQDIVSKMRFQFVEKIPKIVCVYNKENIKANLVEVPFGNLPIDSNVENGTEVDFTSLTDYQPDWSLYPSLKHGTLRDYDYLNLRYATYPFFKYSFFMEGDKKSPAVCIFRIIKTDKDIKVGRILDFYYPENDIGIKNAQNLIRKVHKYFQLNNCDYSDFFCTCSAYIELLKLTGFQDDFEGVLPSLLDPIDMNRRFQNAELYVSRELKERSPNGLNNFFIARGDGDQDRANKSYFLKLKLDSLNE